MGISIPGININPGIGGASIPAQSPFADAGNGFVQAYLASKDAATRRSMSSAQLDIEKQRLALEIAREKTEQEKWKHQQEVAAQQGQATQLFLEHALPFMSQSGQLGQMLQGMGQPASPEAVQHAMPGMEQVHDQGVAQQGDQYNNFLKQMDPEALANFMQHVQPMLKEIQTQQKMEAIDRRFPEPTNEETLAQARSRLQKKATAYASAGLTAQANSLASTLGGDGDKKLFTLQDGKLAWIGPRDVIPDGAQPWQGKSASYKQFVDSAGGFHYAPEEVGAANGWNLASAKTGDGPIPAPIQYRAGQFGELLKKSIDILPMMANLQPSPIQSAANDLAQHGAHIFGLQIPGASAVGSVVGNVATRFGGAKEADFMTYNAALSPFVLSAAHSIAGMRASKDQMAQIEQSVRVMAGDTGNPQLLTQRMKNVVDMLNSVAASLPAKVVAAQEAQLTPEQRALLDHFGYLGTEAVRPTPPPLPSGIGTTVTPLPHGGASWR